MSHPHRSVLATLLTGALGQRRATRLLDAVAVHPSLLRADGEFATRAELAEALALVLLEDVLRKVPAGAAYVRDLMREGKTLVFDHGAIRTVAAPSATLPPGRDAFARILEPLGYELADRYPLDDLGMTGWAFRHRDLPQDLPQYFVSELHPERFSAKFQGAVERLLSTSHDPLPARASEALAILAAAGRLPVAEAARLLPDLAACFDRHHAEPTLEDYETLAAESEEMAWIATEGNAFNHATDRVADLPALAETQRRLGRPMKERIEVSRSGRVLQTAFQAARVERLFVGPEGKLVPRTVPGSFHEFITRHEEAPGRLDLRFDAGNAQAIFKMTRGSE